MKTNQLTACSKASNHPVAADIRRRIPRSTIEVRPPRHLGGYLLNGLQTLLLALMLVGAATSATAQPVIAQQPRNQTNVAGTTAIFSIVATGTPPLSYQWRSHANATSFTNIPGAIEAALALTNVQPTPRRFAVVVTDGGGLSATSSPLASLVVLQPPTFLSQPTNLTLFSASHATFSVSVTGAAPMSLQWYFNDTLLPRQTNRSVTVLNVQLTNQGAYTIVASNFLRAVTSEVATLSLIIPTNGQDILVGDPPTSLPANMRATAEPHLARSYTDPNFIVATFQDGRNTTGGALACGYAVSRDGGATWSRGTIPGLTPLSGGTFEAASDPVAAIDSAGNIFLSTYVFSTASDAMAISKSTNGGLSFGRPVFVVTNSSPDFVLDKNWMTVNTIPGSRTFGRIALTWTRIPVINGSLASPRAIGVSLSDDGGATWSAPHYVTQGDTQGSQPMFLPDGSLALVYLQLQPFRFEMIVSENGGGSFGPVRIIAPVQIYRDPFARSLGWFESATCDRMSGAIHVTWQGRIGPSTNDAPAIFYSRSIDKGITWTTPRIINDTPSGKSAFTPTIAVSADGQHVTVTYFDKRNDPANAYLVDLFLTESFDAGETWQSSVRVTDVTSDLRLAPLTGNGYMLGDYFGLVPALDFNTPAVACWVDTRSGKADLYAMRLDRRRGSTFEAWQRLRFPTNELADASISGPKADPDDDGILNFAEYAHGLEPRHPDPAPLRLTGSVPSLWLSYPALSVLDDVAFSWVGSDDLAAWSAVLPMQTSTNASPDRTMRTFGARLPLDQEKVMGSYRLKLEPTTAPVR